jgi:3-hydroxybutyrate dehydrogenase
MARLEGLVAAVSHGRDGVGHAISEAYRQEGAQVALLPAGTIDERRAAENVVDAALERFGRLDVLVLATVDGTPTVGIADMRDDQWTTALDGTLNHAFWGIRRALQHMIPRGRGRVIVVSSIAAKMAMPCRAASAAGEHAIAGLVKTAAHEVGTLGIKVNAILRGVLEGADHDEIAASFIKRSAIKRPNRLEEIANVAVLLASPPLASVTGCLFPVDGGTMPY